MSATPNSGTATPEDIKRCTKRKRGDKLPETEATPEVAAWLRTKETQKPNGAHDGWMIEHAAKDNRVDVVEYLLETGSKVGAKVFAYAAKGGNVEIMKHLLKMGCPSDVEASMWAVRKGHVEAIKFILENECPLHHLVSWFAARFDKFELLQLLVERGCLLHMFDFDEKNGCFIPSHKCLSEIAKCNCADRSQNDDTSYRDKLLVQIEIAKACPSESE